MQQPRPDLTDQQSSPRPAWGGRCRCTLFMSGTLRLGLRGPVLVLVLLLGGYMWI